MEKNLILAIILSVLVLVAFQFFFTLPAENEDIISGEKQEKVPQNNKLQVDTVDVSSVKLATDLKNLESIFIIETEKLYLKFSNVGGQLVGIQLKDYYETEEKKILLSLLDFTFPLPGIGRLILGDDKINNLNDIQVWQVEESRNSIVFSLNISEDFKIIKRYSVTTPYTISLSVIAENKSDNSQELEYLLFGTSNIDRKDRLDERYANIVIFYGDDKSNKISLSKIEKGITEEPGDFEWLAEINRYFTMIFMPEERMISSIFFGAEENFVAAGARLAPSVIKSNSRKETTYKLYIGPLEGKRLENFHPNCKELIDFGMLTPISVFLLRILRFIYSLVHNYGFSIICLTLLINLFLFPLTRKSFSSMRKMQDLQPEINKLREEHKNNPQKLNKELMELYKKRGGNPLGGCFPMFLQIPVFISLYLALTKSIELKGANFLWINDLSAPDAAFKLPITLPFIGNKINILPILMLIAMMLQQRITQKRTAIQSGSQKQLALIMPLVFGFIFYNFPSGLVLYWLTNTIAMSLVQWKMISGSSEKKVEV